MAIFPTGASVRKQINFQETDTLLPLLFCFIKTSLGKKKHFEKEEH